MEIKMKKETLFYTYNQNNSGGYFKEEHKDGIGHYVIVEAFNNKDANRRAEDIGIYFDGCQKDMDCSCCGDRWYEASANDGEVQPTIFGQPAED
jgi:hypothetical protein